MANVDKCFLFKVCEGWIARLRRSDSESDVKNPPASMKAGQDCQDFFKKSENGCGQESSGGEWKEVASIDGEPNVS